jgi:hypothetical protein
MMANENLLATYLIASIAMFTMVCSFYSHKALRKAAVCVTSAHHCRCAEEGLSPEQMTPFYRSALRSSIIFREEDIPQRLDSLPQQVERDPVTLKLWGFVKAGFGLYATPLAELCYDQTRSGTVVGLRST